ncbi:MAG: type II secretion system F family protein, partial [Deltaproteobacteria bacterium]
MTKFSYRAITETGSTETGAIEAESAEKAGSMLAEQGFIPTRIKEERPAMPGIKLGDMLEAFSPVKAPELILFTKQFNTLIRAGVPMLSLLKVLEEQTEHPRLRKILGIVYQDIKEGSSLFEAFNRHRNVFS